MRESFAAHRPLPLLALLLALEAGAASGDPSAPGAARYSLEIGNARPEVGSVIVVSLKVEGFTASSARVVELRLDSGLGLESESVRPDVSAGGRMAVFRFELRLLAAGERRIESLAVAADEGRLGLGALIVCEAISEKADPATLVAPAWRWAVPPRALRYEAFEARLESEAGPGAPAGISASFALPSGASMESSGSLSWTVIAFEGGELVLPEAALGAGSEAGRAPSAKVSILSLPPEISGTRAIGSFSLSLEGPAPALPTAGSSLRLALVVEGRGNLPALVLPAPAVLLDGSPLPKGAWSSIRADDARPEAGSYVGSTRLILQIVPPRAGALSIRFPALPVLDPIAGTTVLEAPGLDLRVSRSGSARGLNASTRPQSASGIPDWGTGLRGAAEEWARGDKGRALALVYGALRRAPPFSRAAVEAKKAALACAAELGAGYPILDALPPPEDFAFAAFGVAFAGLSLFIVSRIALRKRREAPVEYAPSSRAGGLTRGGYRGAAIGLAALCLILAALGLASAAERRKEYAVIWSDSIRTVPSERSELRIAVVKGSTASLRGASGAYEGLSLADGVEGWATRNSLYFY